MAQDYRFPRYRRESEDRHCVRRSPGHVLHWIQVRLSAEAAAGEPVHVVVGSRDSLLLIGDGWDRVYFHHDLARLEQTLVAATGAVELRPQGLLAVRGRADAPLLFSLATEAQWRPCHPRPMHLVQEDPPF